MTIRLTAIAVFAALTGMASPSQALINGSFEDSYFADGSTPTGTWNGVDLDNLNGSKWDVYDAVPGWTTVDGNGIEVQNNTVVQAQDGSRYVELDSHPGPGSNSTMVQSVATTVGNTYQLDFYYHARPYRDGTSATSSVGGVSTNAIAVGFGGQSFTVDGSPSDGWVHLSYQFTATANTSTLSFSALGLNETYGGFVDNVSLTAVPELDPKGSSSALSLVLGALAVVLGRRIRQTA